MLEDGFFVTPSELSTPSSSLSSSLRDDESKQSTDDIDSLKQANDVLNPYEMVSGAKKRSKTSPFEQPELFIQKIWYLSDSIIALQMKTLEIKFLHT